MGDHDDGHTERVLNFSQQEQDLFAVYAVEIASRLIGEKNCRTIHERARQRAALLLAAGEFARPVLPSCGEPHALQRFGNAGLPVAAIHFPIAVSLRPPP